MRKLGGQKITILLLSAVTVASMSVTVWAVFFRSVPVSREYALVEAEPNAVSYREEEETPQVSSGGGAVSIRYTKQVYVDTAAQTAKIYYANPSESASSVTLQLVLVDDSGQETVLGESGLLQPGTKLEELSLSKVDRPQGEYQGKFVLTFYNADTGEKAILNSVVEGLRIIVE